MTAQEHPEPTEPPAFMTPDGDVYCLVHATTGCTEPWCWKCGSHQMDDWMRCADPRCHASNDTESRAIAERIKRLWSTFGPAPVEVIAFAIGQFHHANGPEDFVAGPSSMQPGEPGGGGDDIGVPATGAGPTKPMAAELPAIDSTRRIEPYRVTRNRERGIR